MLWRGSIIVLLGTCALVACDKNSTSDNAFSAQPVSNTNATLNGARIDKPSADISAADNASKVKRFGDEVPLPPTAMKLASNTLTIRSTPGGEEATVVTTGDGVTALAKKDDWYLVLYSDPSNTQKTLAGWIYKDGVIGPATHPSE
jgi:hypothetical protein